MVPFAHFRPVQYVVAMAALVLLVPLAGCDDSPSAPAAPTPTTIQVQPVSDTLRVGNSTSLSATVLDGDGEPMPEVEVSWSSSNPAVVLVDELTGLATGNDVGTATLTATADQASGSAQITVLGPPIESVTIYGHFRIKAGDSYAYEAEAFLADGSQADRPMRWSILETGMGTMTPDGVLTPSEAGTVTVQVEIEGETWYTEVEVYDWVYLEGEGARFLSLEADTEITSRFGASEYAQLVLACSSDTGNLLIWVSTQRFVTASGTVAYFFDDEEPESDVWIEFSDFSALGHPGPTNAHSWSFATRLANARAFGFAFSEFRGSGHAMIFRVTGLDPLLAPLRDMCPGTAGTIHHMEDALARSVTALRGDSAAPPLGLSAVQNARAEAGPTGGNPTGALPALSHAEPREAARRE